MAAPGPTPKPAEKRQRRNVETFPTTELAAAAKVEAPPLPGAKKFLQATRAWYAVWCAAPQAAQFVATDWQRLHMIAKLVDLYHRTNDPATAKQLFSEIRLNEQKLGATPEDRLRLRWRLADAPTEEPTVEKPRRRRDPRLKLVKGGPA